MAFGIEVKDDYAHGKIQEIRTRLLVNDFLRNPFKSKIVLRGSDFYVISIEPMYPPFYWLAVFPLLIWGLFPGYWFGTIAAIIFFAMLFIGLWWCDWFYFFLFWIVTKKKVKYVGASRALLRVV